MRLELGRATGDRRGETMITVSAEKGRLLGRLVCLFFCISSLLSISECTATPRAVLVKADGGTGFDSECSTGYIVSHNVGRVQNRGDSDLTITDVDIIGRDALAFGFADFDVHNPTEQFQPRVVPSNSTYEYDFGITPRCSAFGHSGQLSATIVIKTNDPRRPTLSLPISATANTRPNLAIADVRGRIIKRHGKRSLRITFNLGNLSPYPTRRIPQVGVSLLNKRRIVRPPGKLEGREARRLGITIRNLPPEVSKFYLGTGTGDFSNPSLADGDVRVDPLNRIHEGNEDKEGSLYDLEYSDYEYQYFVLAAR
jgi:hypothetical protein